MDKIFANSLQGKGIIPSTVILLTILYVNELRPKIPSVVSDGFKNPVVRYTLLTSALTVYNNNLRVSLILVTVFMLFFYFADSHSHKEPFAAILDPRVLSIDSNCDQVTYQDLLDVFDGDESKLKLFSNDRGLFGDLHNIAPLIASYLINSGIPVTKKCSKPFMYDGCHSPVCG